MNDEHLPISNELQSGFEPLRVGFAVLALLLGLLASVHF